MTEDSLKSKQSARKRFPILLIGSYLFLAVAIIGGYFFFRKASEYRKGEKVYAAVYKNVVISEPAKQLGAAYYYQQAAASQETQDGSSPDALSDPTLSDQTADAAPGIAASADDLDFERITNTIGIDFEALQAVNPNAIGWIIIEGTEISYPIVRGSDNDFYLYHLVDGTYNILGSIFMDYRHNADFSSEVTMIYGHNMRDGSMFAPLEQYKNPEYYEQHPTAYILTPTQVFRLELFAGNVVDSSTSPILRFDFVDELDKQNYLRYAKAMSTFQSEVEIKPDDRLVNFFTCTYGYEDARYVVLTKLVQLWPKIVK